jgi:predicted anti-sigma-YlaC factor YlaD
MSDCERLSDRMPAVALGQAGWTADEIRHLNECESCRREWELVQLAGRLGEDAGLSLDPAATAAAVLRRVESERREGRLRRRAWSFAGLAAAAAVAAAIWTGGLQGGPSNVPPVGTEVAGRFSIPLPELDSLEPAELDSVLQTMDEPIVSGSTAEDPLGDLNDDELERVLNSWEG